MATALPHERPVPHSSRRAVGLTSARMFTDRAALRSSAYADKGPLAARIAIYRWQRDPIDFPGLAVAALGPVRGVVVDAGCGLGTYVDRLRTERPDLQVLGLDLSAGMGPHVVGDVQALPLADGSMGGALAMHMLYHVPNIPAAVRELRRVVELGGVVVVSTNGADDKREIGDLFTAAIRDLTGTTIEPPDPDNRFTEQDAGLLREHFEDVEVQVLGREILVPEVGPVVAYVDSMRALASQLVPAHVPWEMFLAAVGSRVADEISANGRWRLHNQAVLVTCR